MRRRKTPVKKNISLSAAWISLGGVCTCIGILLFIPEFGFAGVLWTLGSLILVFSGTQGLFKKKADAEAFDPLQEHLLRGFWQEQAPPPPEEDLDETTAALLRLQRQYVRGEFSKTEYRRKIKEVEEGQIEPEGNEENGLY